jgi:hypothetical protein
MWQRRGSRRPGGACAAAARRRWLLMVVNGAVGLAVVAPAGAAAAEPGGLLVSPSRIDVKVRTGDSLPPIALRNGTGRTLVIDVAAVPARQELSGLPVFELSRRSLAEGRRMWRVNPRRIRLAAGGRATVAVIAGRPPRRGRVGAYGVVAFTAHQVERRGSGAVIAPTVRLASNLLLRYPGPVRLDGRATALRAEQAAKRTLRFLARIRNDGNLHVRPRARLTVTTAAGRPVVRRAFHAENVLPDAERELPLDVTTLLPAGIYRARLDARVGRRRSRQDMTLRLVGPNELPTAALRIVSLQTPQPDASEDFDVKLEFANPGSASIMPTGMLSVARSGDQRPVARRPLRPGTLAPGERAQLTIQLPGVRTGSYDLTARFTSGPRVLAERTVAFQTGTRPTLLERLQDWMASHILLVLAGFAAIVGVLVGALLTYVRRLRAATRSGP